MNKDNPYISYIKNYDLRSLINFAYDSTLSESDKELLIEAIRATLSYYDFDFSCKLSCDVGQEYLDAVHAIEHLTGVIDYHARCSSYLMLIEDNITATSSELMLWINETQNAISTGLQLEPNNNNLLYDKFRLLLLQVKKTNYEDMDMVNQLCEYVQYIISISNDYSFWSTWLRLIVDLDSHPQIARDYVDNVINIFLMTSNRYYEEGKLDIVSFVNELGLHKFCANPPKKIKESIQYWTHEAIEKEKDILVTLTNEELRNRGSIYIDIYTQYLPEREVIEYAVQVTRILWNRRHDWNTLYFYLKARTLEAKHLQNEGNEANCLEIFADTNKVVENVVNSLDLTQGVNFSFISPLLNFLEQYFLVAPGDLKGKLVERRIYIAKAALESDKENYIFPYETLLACQAYLSLPEDFEKTWIQLCLYYHHLYIHKTFEFWSQHPFLQSHDSLKKLFEKTSILLNIRTQKSPSRSQTFIPNHLDDMNLEAMRSELNRLIGSLY